MLLARTCTRHPEPRPTAPRPPSRTRRTSPGHQGAKRLPISAATLIQRWRGVRALEIALHLAKPRVRNLRLPMMQEMAVETRANHRARDRPITEQAIHGAVINGRVIHATVSSLAAMLQQ